MNSACGRYPPDWLCQNRGEQQLEHVQMPKSKPKKRSKKTNSKKGTKKSAPVILSAKERAIQKRKTQQARQRLMKSIGVCAVFAIAVGLPVAFAVKPIIGVGLALGVPTLYLSYQYPRKALWAFLMYLPFNGTVTYWIGGGNVLFQLAKDGLYIPALLGLVQECKRKRKPILIPKKLMPALGLLLGVSLLTLFVVNGALQFSGKESGQPFLQGILGLKVFIGYVPLIFCAYYLIESKKQLLFCSRLHVVLAITCCVLGFMQYWMLSSGRCQGTDHLSGDALFKATLDAKCLVGGSLVYSPSQGMIRLPGTFVSPWHWAWFLIANSALTFTTAFNDPSMFWRIGGLAGMALVFMNAVISGQRIALSLVPVVIGVLLILTGQVANLKRFIPIGVGLALVLTIVSASNPAIIQERWDSFVSRWNASPPQAFIQAQFEWAIHAQKGPFGLGLGRATNSTRVFGDTQLVETYHPKILYEMGWIGLAAFMFFVTRLTMITFQEYRLARTKEIRSFGSSFWVFVLIISYWPYWYPLDTDPVCIYYWFFAGVILRLPEIDRQEQERIRLELEAEMRPRKKRTLKASDQQEVPQAS